ncbi:MAG: hypothetical protein RI580_04985 [Halothece sp. Uz-M2-17]|nr:hypothetical protein [Halothece sp. Uz-M2-17]
MSLALISSMSVSPVFAQTPFEEEDPYPSTERDTFSSELGDGLNPFDLIHRSNFSQGRSIEEYRIEQQQNLNNAASQFRQQQQQLLQQESQNTTEEMQLPDESF